MLTQKVFLFFKNENIKVDSLIVKEFNLWILTVMARKFLKKHCVELIDRDTLNSVVSIESPALCNLKQKLDNIYGFDSKEDNLILLIIFLLFNTLGFHFESSIEEGLFYSTRI
ncbi:hypothetical protein, partial [Enterococcus faecium]|uniref:hypothetical protein n=1 Tax=Enterococcus faecium TaxID=1352 RepID=UPI0023B266B3